MSEYSLMLDKIIAQYASAEMEQICKALNKSYNIYDSEDYRWAQLRYVLSKTAEEDIINLQRIQLSNRVINDLLFKFYPCERVVKYYLIKKLRSLSNHIMAFEMTIGNSRIDICRINGHSYAYEIKTAYDTFERVGTQMADYLETFERVYLVIPIERRSEAICQVPDNCGIITYRTVSDGNLRFHYYRKSLVNTCSIQKCACSLSSADLSNLLGLMNYKNIPALRTEKLEMLFACNKKNFWSAYKKLLKNKYMTKWEFLMDHFNEILPIDIQNFFSTSLNPELVYYTKKRDSFSAASP